MNPLASSTSGIDAQRRRVKLIECQYRKPVSTKFVAEGPLKGALFDPRDKALASALASGCMATLDPDDPWIRMAAPDAWDWRAG